MGKWTLWTIIIKSYFPSSINFFSKKIFLWGYCSFQHNTIKPKKSYLGKEAFCGPMFIEHFRLEFTQRTRFRKETAIIEMQLSLNTWGKYSQKHPSLLSGSSHLTKILIQFEHIRLLHESPRVVLNSLRDKFWIVRRFCWVRAVIL